MRTVNIGIRHNDNLVVSELCNIKFITYACTERSDNGHKLVISVNSVNSCFFNIEHFTPKREDSLNSSVTAALC